MLGRVFWVRVGVHMLMFVIVDWLFFYAGERMQMYFSMIFFQPCINCIS